MRPPDSLAPPRVSECARHHRWPSSPTGDPLRPYWLRRCLHRGPRYVTHIMSAESDYSAVDYVEDHPDGTMTIEAYEVLDAPEADAHWEALVTRLRADDPPRPETG